MSSSFEESDSKAGFYYDIKVLVVLAYVVFFVSTLVLGLILSVGVSGITLTFLGLMLFLDLQEFIEVRVPRYGWRCSKSIYKLASAFLLIGALLVPIATQLMNSGIAATIPPQTSILLFLLSMGLMAAPIVGIALALICYLDFASSLKISLWKRDKEVIEAISKHSFFYRKLSSIWKR